MIKGIVTDIEGTTTSVTFVYEVLFPYARKNMSAFIHSHQADAAVAEQLEKVEQEAGKKLDTDETVHQLLHWMDQDSKITPLKTLQGLIWEYGYRQGDFTGHLYEDVPPKLREWHDRGLLLYVYSSGSIQAQKLLFAHTPAGDLTPLFSGFFDARTGNKRDAQSYQNISGAIDIPADNILFLSDVEAELQAAQQAGFHTILLNREQQAHSGMFVQVLSFNEINVN